MMANKNNIDLTETDALKELRAMFPGRLLRVLKLSESFADKPGEIETSVMIQIGFAGDRLRFEGDSLIEAMEAVRNHNPYDGEVCAECDYGAIDNAGLCVIDDTHRATVSA